MKTQVWSQLMRRRGESVSCRAFLTSGLFSLGLMTHQPSEAALVVNVVDQGMGTVWSYSGTFSSAALGTGNNPRAGFDFGAVSATTPSFVSTFNGSSVLDYNPTITTKRNGSSVTTNTSWGTLGPTTGTVTSGTAADYFTLTFGTSPNDIRVQTLDSNITGSVTFASTSLADWGITDGDIFEYTYATGANTDTITFNFGSAVVPEPSAAVPVLFVSLLAGGLLWRRRKRAASV